MIKTKSKSTKKTEKQSLMITRILNAKPAIVFKAWTKPKKVMRWFSPKGFTTPHCTIDLRAGGICHLCMLSPEGRYFWSTGIFREIIEPHRIVRTDSFSDENGNIISPKEYGLKDWPDETIVTVNLAEYAGRTKLTVQHWPVPLGPERDMCEQGWNQCLDKLADFLRKERI
jgi:uncharacterized protein YndB with AHSA1/START domain